MRGEKEWRGHLRMGSGNECEGVSAEARGSRGSMGSLGQKGKLLEGVECKGEIKPNKSRVGLGQVSFRQEQFWKFKLTLRPLGTLDVSKPCTIRCRDEPWEDF